MIETPLPLNIPPGIVKNGTLEDQIGRWIDSNFVRFTDDGIPVPIGGVAVWAGSLAGTGGVPTGAWTWWVENGLNSYIVLGKQTKLFVANTVSLNFADITPASPPTDLGTSSWTWAFTNLGNVLLFTRAGDWATSTGGNVWKWDPAIGGAATIVANAPTLAHGVVVTPEQFVMTLVADRTVQWASQGTTTTWAPTGTNSAGSLSVATDGRLLRLIVHRGETVALSTIDAWIVDYIAGTLYYGSRKVGEQCGLLGPNCVASNGSALYWMGSRGFYQYDGFVRPVPCPLSEIIFNDINRLAGGRIFAISVPNFNEIWWFYPTAGQTNPNRCVRFNTESGQWFIEPLTRVAGTNGALSGDKRPLLFDANGTSAWLHEDANGGAVVGAFIESGPIPLGDGSQVVRVQKLIPDGARTGDDITLFAGTYPDVAETSTTVAVTAGAGPLDVRFSARRVRYKQTLESTNSRVGVPKLGVIVEGTR